MLRRFRSGLTYANVVATLALFVALGGGAYAAMALPRNSVGTAQLKDGAVTGAKVKARSLLGRDFKAGELPAGPPGPRGAVGMTGAPGTARAYGVVNADGTLVASRSKNATVAPGAHPGIYCISLTGGIDPATTTVVASINTNPSGPADFSSNIEVQTPNSLFTGDCTASQYVVITSSSSNVTQDESFSFVVP